MKIAIRSILPLVLAAAPVSPAAALELFGVQLESSARGELRNAAKKAGLELIREGGEENWFDLYDSSAALVGSRHLYLGFVKRDQAFAFAEYEFVGLQSKRILQNLKRKYGPAEVQAGRFVSDQRYHWRQDGIHIELRSDWQNYRTRLIYTHPANMAALFAERSAQKPQGDDAEQVSLF